MNNCKRGTEMDGELNVVRYEDFGAVGDGVTDDSKAIRAAHNAANEAGLPVLGRADATYYIGTLESSIVIKTSTDWNGAELILTTARSIGRASFAMFTSSSLSLIQIRFPYLFPRE